MARQEGRAQGPAPPAEPQPRRAAPRAAPARQPQPSERRHGPDRREARRHLLHRDGVHRGRDARDDHHARGRDRAEAGARLLGADRQCRGPRASQQRHSPRSAARQRARLREGPREGRRFRHVARARDRRARDDRDREPAVHGARAVPRQGRVRLGPLLARRHDVPDAHGRPALRDAGAGRHREADDRRARLSPEAEEPQDSEGRQRHRPEGARARPRRSLPARLGAAGRHHGPGPRRLVPSATRRWPPASRPAASSPRRCRTSIHACGRAKRRRRASAGTAESPSTPAPTAARFAAKRSRCHNFSHVAGLQAADCRTCAALQGCRFVRSAGLQACRQGVPS